MPEAPARTIRGLGALMITLSAISPTIGVFVVGSDLLAQGGTGAFLAFVGAGLLGLAMASVYAELVSAFPVSGGEYTIFGRVLGPAAAFAILGISLIGSTIALALTGLGVADYLRVVWPGAAAVPIALVTVAAVTFIAVLDIRVNAFVTGAFLILETAALALLTVLGLLHPQRGLGVVLHPVMAAPGGELVSASMAVMATLGAGAVYAFNGYGSVVFIGEEIEDAKRSTSRVIFVALALGALLELVPLLAVIVGAPNLSAMLAARAPLAQFVAATGGPALARLISLSVALAIVNTMIVVALMGGRLLFATGRDGVWPAPVSRRLGHLSPRFGSPALATLVMGAVALLWCLVPLRILVTTISSGTVVGYGGLCCAVIAGRRNGRTAHGAYRMPLFPLAPAVALLVLVAMAATSFLDPAVGRPGLLAMAAIVALSIGYWAVALRGRDRWRLRGPGGPDREDGMPLRAPAARP